MFTPYFLPSWFSLSHRRLFFVLSIFHRLTEDYLSQVSTSQQQMFGGYIDGDGGVRARIKVPKLANNIFNNQPGLVAMEGSRGVALMGGNDNR